ncbi:Bifunctional epoxide hydrolase 2 [Fulvia fulva]|uniref:Bifunctional epoxide hydrolase 2 n=1 Tax=Passalora fulva TaxID=5499 RepID=A0A9Q8P5H7_PASFU|nr:Bifunctional epoxide hydrolase 2 [Fulvia fulva]KAK4630920.1 Bifunctional epoxide hydrolase 2 [Fulvia fulva]KAK4632548.1 Bifunctional epoxide hydrolase 2 [Fulvia fulva]UJO14008.1 Bifunctional epoxide hydrolase 2 [Fulvia fulva]WPV11950.1 Bifunctional epoxide hydrolase 2 [Fulvia fulva]WPV26213.1 Bifunctional epoxide hydrolase 2 [Fulvia fulva]
MVLLEEHEFTWAEKKTAYLAAGPKEGPLLIFIHGWPAIGYTWKPQLETFASLGFRGIAPDMPGYGGSSARKVTEDYSLEEINNSMVALLGHLGRDEAVWIGHDWGCGAVWSFAEHYPEKTTAVCGMAVPSHIIELGLEQEVKYVNREMYPKDKYPYGQWDYQQFYVESFDKATAWFDKDPAAFLRAGYSKGNPASLGQPAFTSQVRAQGGWFGGVAEPDPKWKQIPAENICIDEETYQKLVEAMAKTGFFGADSWYANHERNRKYYDEKAKHEGRLKMPVLFVEAKFDTICDTVNSRLAEPMRKMCDKLTECSIDSGHWVAQEKPTEVNGVIARWIVEEVPTAWPGYWGNKGFIKSKV